MKLLKSVGFRETPKGYKYKVAEVQCEECMEISIKSIKAHRRHPNVSCRSCSQTMHGDRYARLYNIWILMRSRCNNPNNPAYNNYGGRGISVCSEWDTSYSKFKEWAINNGYSKSLSIERVDNDSGYDSDNCLWSDRFTQASNRRLSKKNKSGYIGVGIINKSQKWYSEVQHNNKKVRIGTYKTAIEAAKARDKYVVEHNLPHTLNFK